mmetsp:Transcript_26438/g.66551  ORF Transcript_26438/g.66551 Transcript_26438/m.66551 type:complete len:287 (+) Transcript_26438:1721-2581(+)
MSTWIASSKSRAVAGSMVKILFFRRSFRFATSSGKFLSASMTICSTSFKFSSLKSTSCSSSWCSMSACLSSASRSPARPRHWPFRRPRGKVEVSFQPIIWMGHNLNGSSFPGSPRTPRVTSLIWIKIQGIRWSVGFAFNNVSVSFTVLSLRSLPDLSLGCKVQTMTRLLPRGSAMATTLPSIVIPPGGRVPPPPPLPHLAATLVPPPTAACFGASSRISPPRKVTISSSESESSSADASLGRLGCSASSSSSSSCLLFFFGFRLASLAFCSFSHFKSFSFLSAKEI